jgi:hypothetical protein
MERTMPQLTKGGKWVFGWSVVRSDGDIQIPLEAYNEYGFQPGEIVIITRGSQRSGGFSIAKAEKISKSQVSFQTRLIGSTRFGENQNITLPSETGLTPGESLLVVRGSGLALGFVRQGPIYEEARKHPEVAVYS